MATLRRDEPEAEPQRGPVQPPPEMRVGALVELWAEHAQPDDLGGAFARYHRALDAWASAEGLTPAQWSAATGPRSPWSLATCDAEGEGASADQRLARAGVARTDLPALRRAARARTTDTRRTT